MGYYDTPSDKIFNDIKENAIKIWKTYDDNYFGYATEKINRVNSINNFKDNALFIVAMFDSSNMAKLFALVEPETEKYIRDARGY
jgi:hypothetical protein